MRLGSENVQNEEEAEIIEDRKAFPPGYTEYRKLHHKVMVVAKVGFNNDWAAYCANVPGISSEHEWQEVAANGDKVSREIAEVMFKHLARIYTYRE
jgi:hypothetical protein